jgi:hypothetical protein
LSEGQRGFFRFRLASDKQENGEANEAHQSQIPGSRRKLGADSKIRDYFSQKINRSVSSQVPIHVFYPAVVFVCLPEDSARCRECFRESRTLTEFSREHRP